jgi:hypothetical protein
MDQFRSPVFHRFRTWAPMFLLVLFGVAVVLRHIGHARPSMTLLLILGIGLATWKLRRALRGGNAALYTYLQAYRWDSPRLYWAIIGIYLLAIVACLYLLAVIDLSEIRKIFQS